MRKAAAARAAARRAAAPANTRQSLGIRANAVAGTPGGGTITTLDQLYFSGTYPNFANSPLPNLTDTTNCSAPNFCGIRKFVDTLPGLNAANDIGNMIPVAVPDTTTFPGSDYYEIALVDYSQKFSQDLPASRLRGYVQTNGPNGANQVPYYLGPVIVAHKDVPIRIKFTNLVPSVTTTGNLFIPTDLTETGAGLGEARGESPYLQNRATIHLHGGNTPWISDGTPHQWTVPSSDWGNTLYQRGDSVAFVPDMFFHADGTVIPQCSATVTANCSDPAGVNLTTLPADATNDPGHGSLTFYYTNQQSQRLMFYHDHAYGTTRLNVYAGEVSAYVLRDQAELDLINGTNLSGVFTAAGVAQAPAIPSAEIPLIIQDKTFVPQTFTDTTLNNIALLAGGSGYTAATVQFTGGTCSVAPAATAQIGDMMDPFGQYITGAITGITITTVGRCSLEPNVAIVGDGSGAIAFAYVSTLQQQDPTWDVTAWGGYGNLWYPHIYMPNQWPSNPDGSSANPMGRWDYASWFWPPFNGNPSQYVVRGEIPCPSAYDPNQMCPGFPTPLSPAPAKELDGTTAALGNGSTVSETPESFLDTPVVNGVAYPTLTVDPKPYRFRILDGANERTFNLSWFQACGLGQYTPTAGATCPAPVAGSGISYGTEVGMVPAVTTAGFPVQWPNDARDGGVPDPAGMGPDWIQIGTEGGVLPAPAVIHPTPVNYEQSLRSVTVTNIKNHGLLLMSAERADAIVDFTPYKGRTLILYNDAPAPTPAYDTRFDYYTGDEDETATGGAPTTIPGFGPNTRTVMQVKVNSSVLGSAQPAVNMVNLNKLIAADFKLTQPVPVVPEPDYNAVYGQSFKAVYPTLASSNLTFTPIDPVTQKLSTVVTNIPTTGGTAVTLPLRFKTIQELFELDFGRLNATLGTELPLTNFNTQTTIPLGYIDPFTEDIYDSANVTAQPVGSLNDGTQIWLIIHNGVDSHAIHFHLYDVQLINRFGWDGTNRPPFPNELGWKDTVRMNPLEMDFVALRPVSQTLPFPLPDSSRLFDVTRPAGPDAAMSNFNPMNNAAPQDNKVQTMGWEYVWHCHLLGHEENDMMREQVFQVAPQTPVNLTAVANRTGNILTFTDKSLSEAGFDVQRADDTLFTSNVTLFPGVVSAVAGWNGTATWKDTSAVLGHTYYYRVRSEKPDADYWDPTANNITHPNLVSGWSNVPTLQASPAISANPTSLTFATQAYLTTSAAKPVTVSSVGLLNLTISAISIQGTNAGDFALTSTCPTTPAQLAVNATCPVNVTFRPTYPGQRVATLVINSNDPGTPALSIPLVGQGGLVPATVRAATLTQAWTGTVPAITGTATGLLAPDTIASLGITCTTTYTATSRAGTYPTSCSAPASAVYNYTFVAGQLTITAVKSAMISPTPGTMLSTATNTVFTWSSGGNSIMQLLVGTTGAGSSNLLNTGNISTTSATLNSSLVPTTGTTVYVRLISTVNGVAVWNDYTYLSPGTATPAAMISPTPGSVLSGTVTFTWSTGTGVTSYEIRVGTAVGSNNLFAIGTAATSATMTLPATYAGGTLYVRLRSLINGVYQNVDYVYTQAGTPAKSTLVSITPGTFNGTTGTSTGKTVTFAWSVGTGVSQYNLYVGTTVGSRNLANVLTNSTSATVTTLPANGSTVYVQVRSLINGVWQINSYTVTSN